MTLGQETPEGYLPLDAFAAEAVALLQQQPTPPELLVERVRFLRFAEAEGRFDQTVKQINERVEAARAACTSRSS